jgi:hypothetical protein
MTSVVTESGFQPTSEQVEYAKEYLAESGLGSLIVAVSQTHEAIKDGGLPAIWVDRDSALFAFETGSAGSALFRVYADGHVHLVDQM